jgi:molecular chaperone DnaK
MAVFGIDLGTTDSRIAYVDDAGQPVILKNVMGEDTTPSVVYFESPETVVVGRQAKDSAVLVPDLVVELVKRQMGQNVDYSFHGREHTPESISALILRELARVAQEQTGEEVRDVVITVPAYFGLVEREATRRAGELAGLNVLDVLAEPVAAVLAYQALGLSSEVRHILLYDLGGTFDTTVIRIDGDEIHVVYTDGDNHLGGANWDSTIADFLLHSFTGQYPQLDPAGDEQFMQDLASSAEQLKKALSVTEVCKCNVRYGGRAVQLELTRARLEELTSELLERTMEITGRTIAAAREKGVERFDDVLLVGGMTVMPVIARTLKERFGLDARRHDPQLAVARGAALFALMRTVKASMPGAGDSSAAPDDVQKVANQLGMSAEMVRQLAAKSVTAVVPRAFGLKVVDSTDPEQAREYISPLLTANRPLPADTGPLIFYTAVDNQREVKLEVWEQAGSIASEELEDNSHVADVVLGNLPPRPAGTPIEVVFHMTETGLLRVHGREAGSGHEVRFEIQVGGLNETEIRQATSAVARYEGPQLSPEQLALVRRVAERQARHLDISESQAGLLADAMVEVLAEPEASRHPETTGTPGPAASGAGEPTRAEQRPPAREIPAVDSTPRYAEGSGVGATQESDRVECSVFAPPTVSPGSTFLIQVFAHISSQTRDAMRRAKEFDADAVRRAIKTLESSVSKGTKLSFCLTMPGLRVDDPVQSLVWWGTTESVQFGVSIPKRYRLGKVVGTITISQDWIPVGHIKFTLAIIASPAADHAYPPQSISAVGEAARRYEMAFVSYASEDRTKVLERVQVLPVVGVRTFQDVLDLGPGERWENSLYRHIDESDIVLLFWSNAAKRSKWVRREVRYALDRKHGDVFAPPEIGPVIIEGPPVPRPWKELSELHFNDRIIYFMDR